MRLLRKGKVKDIYDMEDGTLMFHFSDRVSAFDVKMSTPIPRKGEVLCKFSEFWFNTLDTTHHMIKVVGRDKMIVKKLSMLPVECVVRGYFYGSLVDRYKNFLGKSLPLDFKPVIAAKLPRPIFDPTTKSEDHDRPIDRTSGIVSNLLTAHDYDYLEETAISLYNQMSQIAGKAGFIIADVKFEFGRPDNGEIILGDSIGPDEYRLWLASQYHPGVLQDSYDKQLLRDWLTKIGFKELVDQLAKSGRKPDSPEVAVDVASELSRRYIIAYERISGLKL